jgi:hypothetical protein
VLVAVHEHYPISRKTRETLKDKNSDWRRGRAKKK